MPRLGSVRSLLLVPSAVTESEPNDNLPKHEPTSRTKSFGYDTRTLRGLKDNLLAPFSYLFLVGTFP